MPVSDFSYMRVIWRFIVDAYLVKKGSEISFIYKYQVEPYDKNPNVLHVEAESVGLSSNSNSKKRFPKLYP